MSVVRKLFAKRLRALRTSKGYENAKELSDELGIQSGTYNRWERAETEPNYETLLRICQHLETDPNFLLLGKVPPNQ